MELNKIYNGDCLEFMKSMPDKSVDLCLTDPPYGIGVDKMTLGNGKNKVFRGDDGWDDKRPDKELFDEIFRVSRYQIIWGGNYFASSFSDARCWLVWDKKTGQNDYADCELAWTNLDMVVKKFTQLWLGANAKDTPDRVHPTQKSKSLMGWCIELYEKKYGTPNVIFDPFAGSGTTLVAAKELNRNFLGCEISPEYCKIAEERLKGVTKSMF